MEPVFGVVKRLWGFTKLRDRGLAENATRPFVALGLANVFLTRKRLLVSVRPKWAQGASDGCNSVTVAFESHLFSRQIS